MSLTDEEIVTKFANQYSFKLDQYQIDSIRALISGKGVLVAAPTGAGKTVVGEFAVWLATQTNRKCFYTTPIKALSNQKFHDLERTFGAERVGLLTGDISLNSDAQIVVMTTEVLRNMIYAGSDTLNNLGYVVLDEVHYLADRFRGAVWEEVILGLAASVQIVALSATVSNVEDFGDWLDEVRDGVVSIVSEVRPVPLYQHVLSGRRLVDLFASKNTADAKHIPDVNPELLKISRLESMRMRDSARRPRGKSGRGKKHVSYGTGNFGLATHEKFRPKKFTSRLDMVSALDNANLLPAICFIFSRIGCDSAVQQIAQTGIQLTTSKEQELLAQIADSQVSGLSESDLAALKYEDFRFALINGIAAHHAGLLPTFKAIVEEGFSSGALKMVFATETLALGINMPARTVVLEKLVKYNGEVHADITPGEYTQLTGRAGRRGIDIEGHAVVVWQPGMDPRALAGLASRRTYPLRSSFAPTYNMAVNLVQTQGKIRARRLLEQSFAQYQADKSVVATSRTSAELHIQLEQERKKISCEFGDFMSYARMRDEISRLEAEGVKERKAITNEEIAGSIVKLLPGDIIWLAKQGWCVVLNIGRDKGHNSSYWMRVLTSEQQTLKIESNKLKSKIKPVARVKVPRKFSLRERSDRRAVLAAMKAKVKDKGFSPPREKNKISQQRKEKITQLRHELSIHPSHKCPDREIHAIQAASVLRIERALKRSEEQATQKTNSLAKAFDRVCGVLDELGYLENDQVTDLGAMLAKIYNELDLVAAQCIRLGVFEGLDAAELAAVISSLVYESRPSSDRLPARMPTKASERAQSKLREVWHDVGTLERTYRLEHGREPNIGFAEAAWRWASGQNLAKVLATSGLSAGDFVRWARQVIDVAGQIAQAAGSGDLRRVARQTSVLMCKGVVDYDNED